ncbi:lysylphosphatidylglycerol synthase domain-containing protein [Paraburkholderia sp. J10-1]|uniref:lysylphosphatidylglycerol synthase domain-containing protein n=1 Tax=Paraburkholderia sp. J10-1 TaxID=2805430 RepID=UPI002AB7D9B6|nr:lysylphosphatidylglycerol synthase domain-containing protein [Paraburkholderia sp. J10-1]
MHAVYVIRMKDNAPSNNGSVVVGPILGMGGLVAGIALVVLNDPAQVLAAVTRVGWSIAAIVAVRAIIIALTGVAWGQIVRPLVRRGFELFVVLRWVREAINVLLPVASVGGDVVGARLLTFYGVSGGLAGASILADLLIQSFSGLLFTIAGLVLLAADGRGRSLTGGLMFGIMLGILVIGGFYVAQRAGFFALVERAMLAAGRWSKTPFSGELKLHENLQRLYENPVASLRAILAHFVAWLAGTAEVWIALECMGASPSIVEAMVLESLGQAVRAATFPVPGAFGVQEGGFLLLGQAYGIPAEIALALSLVKRVPDIVLGLPGLFFWHLMEARRIVLPSQALSTNEPARQALRQSRLPGDR